jgi:hypothetical protein
MADDIYRANDYAARMTEAAIERTARDIDPGYPGECDLCGEYTTRLIGGACAPCRERYGLE